MTEADFYSHPIKVDEIPDRGLAVEIDVPAEALQVIAKAYGLVGIASLKAHIDLKRRGKEVLATGRMQAEVTQTCVVTLDAFAAVVEEEIDLRFAPDAPALDDVNAPLDAPDPIIGGAIDLGRLVVEFLALSLDPYPRKPGAEFHFEGEGAGEHPFAALKKWTKE
jgi:uncharacterized metal-binding protein YceD (DUF177 family)